MRERLGLILKLACYVLAALLLYQVVQTGRRLNPLARVKIPALPTLDSETNSLTAGAPGTNAPARTGTNSPGTNSRSNGTPGTASAGVATNSPTTNSAVAKAPIASGTNLVATIAAKPDTTNTPTAPLPTSKGGTNIVLEDTASAPTNSPTSVLPNATGSNLVAITLTTNTSAGINDTPTNFPPALAAMGTNVSPPISALGTNGAGTNASAKSKKTNSPPSAAAMAAMNMNPAMMRGGGGKSDLPPEIKARVDKIYESELFGMIIRPQPMSLQGIAGDSAFLRTPSGQTGLVKEGDSLGEIKLLRIGINRVLVEQDGQKSELMIFNGYGGESLMPKDKETSK